jgi:hypothetical protein
MHRLGRTQRSRGEKTREGAKSGSGLLERMKNFSELCAADFDLREVIPPQLEAVSRGGRVRPSSRFTAWVPGGMYSPWITTMSSGHDVSEYVLDTSGLPLMFHHNNRGKIDKNREKS